MITNRYAFFLPIALFSFLCLFSSPIQAQTTMSVAGQVGIPTGALANNLDGDLPVGVNLQYLKQINQSPLSLGVGVNLMGYSCETWNEYWAIGESVVDADYTRESMTVDIEGRMRLELPISFPITPYFEGFGGMSMAETTLVVEDNSNAIDCDNVVYDETLSRDWAPSYGIGAGLLVPICNRWECGTVFLDLGVSSRNSGAINYMNRDADEIYSSGWSMWQMKVGLTVRSF